MTIKELLKICKGNKLRAARLCGISKRQLENYIRFNKLPVERAALAKERLKDPFNEL